MEAKTDLMRLMGLHIIGIYYYSLIRVIGLELICLCTYNLTVQVEEVDERLLSKFSYLACGDVSPMQAVIGSIAAQEVVKVSA